MNLSRIKAFEWPLDSSHNFDFIIEYARAIAESKNWSFGQVPDKVIFDKRTSTLAVDTFAMSMIKETSHGKLVVVISGIPDLLNRTSSLQVETILNDRVVPFELQSDGTVGLGVVTSEVMDLLAGLVEGIRVAIWGDDEN